MLKLFHKYALGSLSYIILTIDYYFLVDSEDVYFSILTTQTWNIF